MILLMVLLCLRLRRKAEISAASIPYDGERYVID